MSGHHADAGTGRAPAGRAADRRALGIALGITLVFLAVEIAGGLVARSLALLADAGHMATDAASLALALFAARLASRDPTAERSFGLLRAEILAALANGIVLGVVSVFVVIEAVRRLGEPAAVRGGLMLGVAIAGLVANLAAALVLARGRERSLNVRSAFLHVAGDAIGFLGTIAAAAAIVAYGWTWTDPAAAIAIALLILVSAWLDVLMEGTPAHVDVAELLAAIRGVPGVADVHDLHVWTLTSEYHALSAHIDVHPEADAHAVLARLQDLAARRFDVSHTTFQLEPRAPLLQIEGVVR
jgi:cobalt-zinc-cadmium efflux system protein